MGVLIGYLDTFMETIHHMLHSWQASGRVARRIFHYKLRTICVQYNHKIISVMTINFCTCPDSTAAGECAKVCGDKALLFEVTMKDVSKHTIKKFGENFWDNNPVLIWTEIILFYHDCIFHCREKLATSWKFFSCDKVLCMWTGAQNPNWCKKVNPQ